MIFTIQDRQYADRSVGEVRGNTDMEIEMIDVSPRLPERCTVLFFFTDFKTQR